VDPLSCLRFFGGIRGKGRRKRRKRTREESERRKEGKGDICREEIGMKRVKQKQRQSTAK
jgi:hypothetical protein